MIGMNWWQETFSLPFANEPEWAPRLERWYQLDAPAMTLAETFWRHRQLAPPKWIIVASPGGSNFTDMQFARANTPSPAKFVHTLPNIRVAPLLQLMNWNGSVLCIQKDPFTLCTAISEAAELCKEDASDVWVVSVTREQEQWTGHILTLCVNDELSLLKIAPSTGEIGSTRDKELLLWTKGLQVTTSGIPMGAFTLSTMI